MYRYVCMCVELYTHDNKDSQACSNQFAEPTILIVCQLVLKGMQLCNAGGALTVTNSTYGL